MFQLKNKKVSVAKRSHQNMWKTVHVVESRLALDTKLHKQLKLERLSGKNGRLKVTYENSPRRVDAIRITNTNRGCLFTNHCKYVAI